MPRARSSRSPRGQGLPARHVLHQERGREAPVSAEPENDRHGDITVDASRSPSTRITPATPSPSRRQAGRAAPPGRRRVRAAPGRRRARAQPAPGHWDHPAPRSSKRTSPSATSPWTSWATPVPSSATPADRDGRSEDDLAYFRGEHEFRSRGSSSSPTATSRSPSPGSSWSATYQFELYRRLAVRMPTLAAGIAAKASKEWTTTATTAPSGRCASPRRHRRVPRAHDPRLQGHLALRRRAVPRRRAHRAPRRRGRRRRSRPACAPTSTGSPPCSPRPS